MAGFRVDLSPGQVYDLVGGPERGRIARAVHRRSDRQNVCMSWLVIVSWGERPEAVDRVPGT